MKILHKTLVIFAVATILFIGASHIIVENVIMKGFLENEAIEVQETMERVKNAIDVRLSEIEKGAIDWSAWDDTYQFIIDRNEDYIRSNLQDETLINLDLNLMLFVNSSNQVVFGKALDLYSRNEIQIPESILTEISSGTSPLLVDSGTSGLILTGQGPMMIVSKPILTSKKEGPARGFLIFGRYLDTKVLESIEDLTGVRVSLHALKDFGNIPAGNVVVTQINESFVGGILALNDVHGKPIIAIQCELPRIFYQQGRVAATNFLILLTLCCLLFLGLIFVLIYNSILSKIKRLDNYVQTVGKNLSSSELLFLEGEDEISNLNRSVNEMLSRLSQAHETIKRSEEKYRRIFEGSGVAMFMVDGEMRIKLANNLTEKLFDYSRNEMEGKMGLIQLIYEEDISTVLSYHKRCEEGEAPSTFEVRVKDRYGNIKYCLVSMVLMPSVNEIAVWMVDITKRKILEIGITELLEQLKWLEEIIEKSPTIAFMWKADEGWPVEYVSNNIQQFGYTPKDFTSGKIKYADIVYGEDLERVAEEVREYTRKGLDEFAQEYRIVTSGGDVRWVYDRTWLRRGETGEVTHYQGVILDITERKWMEEQIRNYSEELKRYSKHLEELVEEKTRELREKERLAAIGQTAVMVGHDLRNPLQVMKNILYILKERTVKSDFKAELKDEILERIKTIDKQILYMNKIVLDLQDFSKERVATPTLVEPRKIIEELLELVPQNINVVMDVDSKLKAFVDQYMFTRICSNLILNAVQAMPQSGTLKISSKIEGKDFIMKISDTGAGMPKEVMDKLFTPFYTTKSKGMGLGLSVCKKLVEAHNGVISVESEVGKGTTFTIRIPQKV